MRGAAAQGRSGRGLGCGGGQGFGVLRGGPGEQRGKALLGFLVQVFVAGPGFVAVGVAVVGQGFLAQDRFYGVVALGLGAVDVALILVGAIYAPG